MKRSYAPKNDNFVARNYERWQNNSSFKQNLSSDNVLDLRYSTSTVIFAFTFKTTPGISSCLQWVQNRLPRKEILRKFTYQQCLEIIIICNFRFFCKRSPTWDGKRWQMSVDVDIKTYHIKLKPLLSSSIYSFKVTLLKLKNVVKRQIRRLKTNRRDVTQLDSTNPGRLKSVGANWPTGRE